MNSLQLQCWNGGTIPVLNPTQIITEFNLLAGISQDLLSMLSMPDELTKIKALLIVNDDSASTSVLSGGVFISIDYGAGWVTFAGSSGETNIFIITTEEITILNLEINNSTNKQMKVFVYS